MSWQKPSAWSMQWNLKIVSAGQGEDICILGIILVINLPVSISQQVFRLCEKDFEDINSSFCSF